MLAAILRLHAGRHVRDRRTLPRQVVSGDWREEANCQRDQPTNIELEDRTCRRVRKRSLIRDFRQGVWVAHPCVSCVVDANQTGPAGDLAACRLLA
jgi:hypothetical protein